MAVFENQFFFGGTFEAVGGKAAGNIGAMSDLELYSPVPPLGSASDLVSSLAAYDDELYAAGTFGTAGNDSVAHIARWDGALSEVWRPLGTGLGGDEVDVNDMLVHGGKLFVAGVFETAGGVVVNNIASWNGSSWEDLDGGLTHPTVTPEVVALVPYGDDLVVAWSPRYGPMDQLSELLRWNGSSWSSFDDPSNRHAVTTMCIHQGRLVAGGRFYVTDITRSFSGVAIWDGSSWTRIGSNAPTAIPTSRITSVGEELYYAETGSVNKWNGVHWDRLAALSGAVSMVTFYQGTLIALGDFKTADGMPVNGLARLSEGRWHPVDDHAWGMGGLYGPPRLDAFTVFGGELVATGNFASAGISSAQGIASWNGTSWRSLAPQGIVGEAKALATYRGDLVAAGSLTEVDGVPVHCIARFDGTHWSEVGGGITGSLQVVHALAEYEGSLIAAGSFSDAGGELAYNIARWDGTQWHQMHHGLYDLVRCLTVHNGELYAGGEFDWDGFEPFMNIARWSGSLWNPVGGGADGPVEVLASFQGKLHAAGSFSRMGGQDIPYLAAWDGTTWGSVGGGVDSPVTALAQHGHALFVGGPLRFVGGSVPVLNVAAWNGSQWSALEYGLAGRIRVLASYNGSLYVGGERDQSVSGYPPSVQYGIARWVDGTTPVEVTEFAATAAAEGTQLQWRLQSPEELAGIRLQRSEEESGPYLDLHMAPLEPRSQMSFLDAREPEISWYRLQLLSIDGTPSWFGPIRFDPQGTVVTPASLLVRQIPGGARVRYSVGPRSVQALLGVYDVRGRCVATLTDALTASGQHEVEWCPTTAARGVYIMELRTPATRIARKFALVGR